MVSNECYSGVLRVLVNITHNSIAGCKCVSSFDGVIEILLKCILQSPQYVLDEQRLVLRNELLWGHTVHKLTLLSKHTIWSVHFRTSLFYPTIFYPCFCSAIILNSLGVENGLTTFVVFLCWCAHSGLGSFANVYHFFVNKWQVGIATFQSALQSRQRRQITQNSVISTWHWNMLCYW